MGRPSAVPSAWGTHVPLSPLFSPYSLGEAPLCLLLLPQTPFILGKLSVHRSWVDKMTFSELSHKHQCATDDDCEGKRRWWGLGPSGL